MSGNLKAVVAWIGDGVEVSMPVPMAPARISEAEIDRLRALGAWSRGPDGPVKALASPTKPKDKVIGQVLPGDFFNPVFKVSQARAR